MAETIGSAAALASMLAREAHVISRDPDHVVEHLHNCLLQERGEEGVGPLLADARRALRDRTWLRLVAHTAERRRPGPSSTVRTLDHSAPVRSVAWSPDGSRIASSGDDGAIRVWDPQTGRMLSTHQASGSVASLSWSPWHRPLASGDTDGYVRLWNPDTWACDDILVHEERWLSTVAWQPGGSLLAAGSGKRCVLWAPGVASEPVAEVPTASIFDLAWSPGGTELAIACFDATVSVWDLVAGTLTRLCLEADPVHAVAWSPDGRTIATTAGDDGLVALWRAEDRSRTASLDGHRSWVWTLGWSPDGRVLSSGSGSDDRSVGLWDTATLTQLDARHGHTDAVFSVAWSPAAHALASGSGDGSVILWDTSSGGGSEASEGHSVGIEVAAWSREGTALATGADDGLRLWGRGAGPLVVARSAGWLRALAWRPGGAQVAVSRLQHPSVLLVDAFDGSVTSSWSGSPGAAHVLAWHPRDAVLAIGGDDGILALWDTGGDRSTAIEGSAGPVSSLAWNADGTTLAIGHPHGEIDLVDVAGGPTVPLRGHTGCVRELAWSQAARALASAADDGDVRVWRADARWAGLTLSGHAVLANPRTAGSHLGVRAIDWSPDGRWLVSGGQDTTVRLWEATAEGRRALARCPGPVLAVRFTDTGTEVLAADDGSHAGNVPARYRYSVDARA